MLGVLLYRPAETTMWIMVIMRVSFPQEGTMSMMPWRILCALPAFLYPNALKDKQFFAVTNLRMLLLSCAGYWFPTQKP